MAKLIPYRSSSRSSRSRDSRAIPHSRVVNRSTEASRTVRSPWGSAASCRSASQSAAVSRPASVVSASSPTTGTTSETTRRSTLDWSAASGATIGHGSGAAAGELVDLVEQAQRVDRVAGQPRRDRPERLQGLHVVLTDRLGEHVDDRLGAGQRTGGVGVEVVVDRRLGEQEPAGLVADTDVFADDRPGVSTTVRSRRWSLVRVTST